VNKDFHKVGQLQSLVRTEGRGQVTDRCKCYAKFRRLY